MKVLFGAWQQELSVCSTGFSFFLFVSPGLVRGFFFSLNSDPKDRSRISTSVGLES